ncbi:DUF4251 domain-containing protein [Reichenbachiella sp. MSK19-1]|uniref:DUF4251 domain-containing protein n=1 Tax=Reichenbachiella sp. MSK19-1 TaxID=1897631 RepID=UPI001313FBC0|nr:DUF4251 domain-containing protein [Reichenbachiella sp. MSK19-1]
MKSLLLILAFLLLTVAVVFGQDKKSRKEAKKEKQRQEYMETKMLLDSGAFSFTATWATTQKGRRINLIGNSNQLTLEDTLTSAYLPYFGVVQMYDMSGEGGINFEGTAQDLKIEHKDKKMRSMVSFEVKSSTGNEVYQCQFTINSNSSAALSVRSSARNQISYDGTIAPLPDEKKK